MANPLDEMNDSTIEEGKDINVIAKQIPVKVGKGSKVFEVILWVLGIIPGLVFLIMKIKAATYLRQLEQKVQSAASDVDNYLEQRVVVLSNLVGLVNRAIDLDKSTFTQIAAKRTGLQDNDRNDLAQQTDSLNNKLRFTIENYPELKAHQEIQDAIQQNSYLQKEITAARDVYNDVVYTWNKEIQVWPTKMIVAAKQGYTTRIPFIASKETKERARDVFF